MDELEFERRVRIEIDLGKEIPSEELVRLWDEAVAATPSAVQPQTYDRVWRWRVAISEPGSNSEPAEGSGLWSSLGDVIAYLRQHLFVALVKGLAVERIPVDPRFADAVGTGPEPSAKELAAAVARALGITEPTHPGTVRLLNMLAVAAHLHYDNPLAIREATTVKYMLTPHVVEALTPDELASALAELGLDPQDDIEETVGGLAVLLLIQMGFAVG